MTARAARRGGPAVGLFTYSTAPRGSVVHTAYLADALADAGVDVTVFALDKDGAGFFRPLRAKLSLIPAAPAPSTTYELVRLRAAEIAAHLLRHAPELDIHHAQDCLSANGLLAAHERGAPVTMVRTVHHVERFADPDLAACQERSIRGAVLRFAVSETTRSDLAAAFATDAVVVGNGVDVRRFQHVDAARLAHWRARLGSEAPVVLAVGGVEPRKNTARTLQAFAQLRGRHPHARLWILGGATVLDHGVYRAAFGRRLLELSPATQDAVIELGVVADDDVPALFHLANALALPSLHEGFGLAALEALAAGLPVVASNAPPFTEFLDASCAELVDPEDTDAITAGLLRAVKSSPERSHAGRERARAHAWSRVAAVHIEHYERIIADAGDALRRSLA